MYYLIDGYNLLFRHLRDMETLQKQRDELIASVAQKFELLSLDATVVFDSHYQQSESTKHHFGRLEIIYTDVGETADEYILKYLKELAKPSEYIVVTSDKSLANQCRLRFAKTMATDDFLRLISRRKKNIVSSKQSLPTVTLRPLIKTPVSSKTTSLPEKPKKHSEEDYEKIFNENLEKLDQEQQNKRMEKKILKKKKIPNKKNKTPKKEILSDMERWLRAFENEDLSNRE